MISAGLPSSDWGGDRLRDDVRWKFGVPPAGNANFAWLQHIIHHLAPRHHDRTHRRSGRSQGSRWQ
jgi:type I restriction-modification system DNA methylase subunit